MRSMLAGNNFILNIWPNEHLGLTTDNLAEWLKNSYSAISVSVDDNAIRSDSHR